MTVDTPTARLWLVFFGNPRGVAWWCRILRPGFRHCYAASFYADRDMWVVFNPTRRGSVIELWPRDEFGPRLAQFLDESSAVLRVASRHERGHAPALWFCVAAMKQHLGVKSAALTPWRLYRSLIARGAEVVESSRVPGAVLGVRDDDNCKDCQGRNANHERDHESDAPFHSVSAFHTAARRSTLACPCVAAPLRATAPCAP